MTATTPDPTLSMPSRSHLRAVAIAVAVPIAATQFFGTWVDTALPLAFGVVFLASVALDRPLIAILAKRHPGAGAGRGPDLDAPAARRALSRITTVWGLALVAQAAILADLAATASASTLGLVNNVMTFGVQGLLTAGTVLYVRRRRAVSRPAH